MQESRKSLRTFLWRLKAAATKANVDYHFASWCCQHVNQFLKSLGAGRYQLKDILKQGEEIEQGMHRMPANEVQFRHHKLQRRGPGAPTREASGLMPPWRLLKSSNPRFRTPET
ncbi:hypothetical protein PHMEG_0002396 [Phytophthora megakarya]|uniref:Uncharacterized protein n=1 Tax=Phytophthora megakarya TaxID=4795 RepID=A0A225WZE7_9STRA|nr:hypothetical protein PHMEG_0002396 [Phytophthora megakarya]